MMGNSMYMYLHAASGGGSSLGPVNVVSSSSSFLGLPTDLVMIDLVGAQGGDSGGLWYSLITQNNKTYAVIEGIHKGVLQNAITGEDIYSIFSKFANVYTGLSLSSIYVDSTYPY